MSCLFMQDEWEAKVMLDFFVDVKHISMSSPIPIYHAMYDMTNHGKMFIN